MPEVRKVTVKPSGGDYTSVGAAIEGEKGNLVALDRQVDIEVYAGLAPEPPIVIDGSTTDATRYMRIYAAASDRHAGKWDLSKAAIIVAGQATGFTCIQVADPFVRIEGLLIGADTTDCRANAGIGGVYNNSDYARIDGCIITRSGGSLGFYYGITPANYPTGWRITNCLLIGPFTRGLWITTDNAARAVAIYNCTVVGCATGIYAGTTYAAIRNVLAVDNTTCFTGTYQGATGNNVSSDATAPGTPVATGKTSYGDYFADFGDGDYRLVDSSTVLFGIAGADLSAVFETDILGAPRVAWDIGAFQAPSVVGAWDITGDVSLAIQVAGETAYQRHAALSGTVAVSITPAAQMAYNRHAALDGTIAVAVMPAGQIARNRHAALDGAVAVSVTPGAQMVHNRHGALEGTIMVAPLIAAELHYRAASGSITGQVLVPVGISGAPRYNRHAACVGGVHVTLAVQGRTVFRAVGAADVPVRALPVLFAAPQALPVLSAAPRLLPPFDAGVRTLEAIG